MDTVLVAAGSLWPTNIRLAAFLPSFLSSLVSFPSLSFPFLPISVGEEGT